MNLGVFSLGIVSLYVLTGSFACLILSLLAISARIPFYAEIISAFDKAPIVSLVITIPFVALLGIFTDAARLLIAQTLLKRPLYEFDNLVPSVKSLAVRAIGETLHIKPGDVDLDSGMHFLSARQVLVPSFDEYKNQDRWLYDFFQNSLVISVFALLIVAARSLAFPLGGLDWGVVIICGMTALVFGIRLKSLKKAYTLHEVSLVIHQHEEEYSPQ